MSKPFYWMGALALITLVLYSCQKDEFSDNLPTTTTENPITPETPTTDTPVLISDGHTIDNEGPQGPIGIDEIKGSIKAKAIIRDIIHETFMQLLLSHDFNPLMPPSQRETCDCNGIDECGCPMQETTTPATQTTDYPKSITLMYKDKTTCNTCSPLLSDLNLMGDIPIKVTGPLGSSGGHTIEIGPVANFIVDDHEFSSNTIVLNNLFAFGTQSGYSLTVTDATFTDANGAVTTFVSLDPNTFLQIDDLGTPHGDINNGFGLLDDKYSLYLEDLVVKCSNGVETTENTNGTALVYDMNCECIQDGLVSMTDAAGNLIATYNYGYVDDPTLSPGDCDDKIEVTTCGPGTLVDPNGNSALIRTGGAGATIEIIDCL